MRQHTGNARDAALRRLRRSNRWLIAGSVALTGILAEVAAQAFPGKSLHGASSGAASSSGAKGASHPTGSQSSSSTKLQPPAQGPEAHPAPAPSGESSTQASGQPSPSSEGQSGSGAESSQPSPQESAPPVVSGGS